MVHVVRLMKVVRASHIYRFVGHFLESVICNLQQKHWLRIWSTPVSISVPHQAVCCCYCLVSLDHWPEFIHKCRTQSLYSRKPHQNQKYCRNLGLWPKLKLKLTFLCARRADVWHGKTVPNILRARTVFYYDNFFSRHNNLITFSQQTETRKQLCFLLISINRMLAWTTIYIPYFQAFC